MSKPYCSSEGIHFGIPYDRAIPESWASSQTYKSAVEEAKKKAAEMFGQGVNCRHTTIPCFSRYSELYPTRIITNGPATIVFWADGTKTIVKRMEGAPDDPYAAVGAALMKKVYGTSSAARRIVRKVRVLSKEEV